MFIEHIKTAYSHWSTTRKVEPVNPVEEEFPLEKQEQAVIVEIESDGKDEDEKLSDEPVHQPETKHTLSIWV